MPPRLSQLDYKIMHESLSFIMNLNYEDYEGTGVVRPQLQ
jgi:hypothetical protein